MSLRSDVVNAQTDEGTKERAEREAYIASMYGERKKRRVKRKRTGIVDDDLRAVATAPDSDDDEEEKAFLAQAAEQSGVVLPSTREAAQIAAPSGNWSAVDTPQTGAARHDSDSDSDGSQQPPTRRPRYDSSDDAEERRAAPPARRARHDSSDSASSAGAPPRQGDADATPPPLGGEDVVKQGGGDADSDSDLSPVRKESLMEDGTTAGLKSAAEQAEENKAIREKQEDKWRNVNAALTGAGASTMYDTSSHPIPNYFFFQTFSFQISRARDREGAGGQTAGYEGRAG